ncbi:MAG: lysophospholipid transporter LplT, partial [Betaproteobacteria bacterium]
TGARYPKQKVNPIELVREFAHCCRVLWLDKLGQISLAVTTLFWGAGATLQFIVLDWAKSALDMPLNRAAILQGVVAVGIAGGAVIAARILKLRDSVRVLPVGVAMGLVVPLMTLVNTQTAAFPLLILIGALAGFFVVPMNALLQHRGHVLMSAGHSIAVQNFNENLNILVMLGIYAGLIRLGLHVNIVIILFGAFVALTMAFVIRLHRSNQRKFDSVSLIGEARH